MRRKANKADLALSLALKKHRVAACPRKIETARQYGLLPETQRRGLGRGNGSESVRSQQEIETALTAFALLDEVGAYADTVLAGFVRGMPVTKDRFERAYAESLGRLSQQIERRTHGMTSVIDKAGELAWFMSEHIRKGRALPGFKERLRQLGLAGSGVPVHRALHDLGTDLFQIVIGVPPNSSVAEQAAGSLRHFVDTETAAVDVRPQAPTPLLELIPELHLNSLPRLVRRATSDELSLARDHALALREFARAFGDFIELRDGKTKAWAWVFVGQTNDVVLAWTLPALIWLHHRHEPRLSSTIAFLAQWTAFFQAANQLLARLPEPLRIVVQPDGLTHLDDAQRHDLAGRLARLEISDPDLMKTVHNPPLAPGIVG